MRYRQPNDQTTETNSKKYIQNLNLAAFAVKKFAEPLFELLPSFTVVSIKSFVPVATFHQVLSFYFLFNVSNSFENGSGRLATA